MESDFENIINWIFLQVFYVIWKCYKFYWRTQNVLKRSENSKKPNIAIPSILTGTVMFHTKMILPTCKLISWCVEKNEFTE